MLANAMKVSSRDLTATKQGCVEGESSASAQIVPLILLSFELLAAGPVSAMVEIDVVATVLARMSCDGRLDEPKCSVSII